MRMLMLALAAALFAMPMRGEPGGAVLQVDYSNANLVPARWTLVLHADGSGHFHSDRGNVKLGEEHSIEPITVDRDIRLTDDFTSRVFDTMRRQKRLNEGCESHLKVAYQGTKKFTFTPPEGAAESCEFNYSKNREIQALSDSFISVASTIIEGARLELLLQHDPLGLDKEMGYLLDGAKDGRLQQICTIRGILERLENDPHVMERVRKRARTLLARADN